MFLPKARAIETLDTVLPQVESLVEDWLANCDRQAPVPPDAVREVNALIADARTVLARSPNRGGLDPLPTDIPVSPAACFVVLLKAREALWAFANRYSTLEGTTRTWFHAAGTRCPVCLKE
jgi:hypothetical protein